MDEITNVTKRASKKPTAEIKFDYIEAPPIKTPLFGDEPAEEEVKPFYKEWIEIRPGEYIPSDTVKITKFVQPGMYNIEWDHQNGWPVFLKQKINLDELFVLPDPVFNTILNDMKYFWDNEIKFKNYKYAYKRGILLYGPPGSGKSSLVALLSEAIIKKQGVVISIKNGDDLVRYVNAIGKAFRHIEPTTPILTLIEDIDGLLAYKDNETLLLNILDGIYQSHNVVYLACTNYPEKLEERILNRPSRFDKRYLIDLPNAETRKFYLEKKIKSTDLDKVDLDDVVSKTEGLSLAHLGEFIKSVFIFGKSIEDSIGELKDMGKFISSSRFKTTQSKTGFSK